MKLVCSFHFDGWDYQLIAFVDRDMDVTGIDALPNKGPQASDVAAAVTVLGRLMQGGLPFQAVAETQKSPLHTAMVASIERQQEAARACMRSARLS